ncbi:hypothetical protein OQA88_11596 [Cercophora sp. LCS_1]
MMRQPPTPPTTSSGTTPGGPQSTPQRQRFRRRAEVSSSSESALGKFGVSNLPNRIVAPPRPLPLETLPSYADSDTDLIVKLFGPEFERYAQKLLSGVGASARLDGSTAEVDIVARMFRDDPGDVQPTIFMIVNDGWEWDNEQRKEWVKVVCKLKCYVDGRVSETAAARDIDVCVEMLSKSLVAQKYLTVISGDEPGSQSLIKSWPDIRDVVLEKLESYSSTAGCMTSIALFRLGYSMEVAENPKTVYISVDYDSPASGWSPVVDAIQEFLNTFRMGLKVHIEHGVVGLSAGFRLVPSELTPGELLVRKRDFAYEIRGPYSKKIAAGSDISAARYLTRRDGKTSCPTVGTLGCWVQVKITGKEGWTTMGLTCFHVVRPCFQGFNVGVKETEVDGLSEKVNCGATAATTENSPCWNAEVNGVTPQDTVGTTFRVESPPRVKHNVNVANKTDRINQLKKEGLPTQAKEKELQGILEFFDNDNHLFGRPHLASGYLRLSRTNGRLDWALISLLDDKLDRVGGNPLPSEDEFVANGYDSTEAPVTGEGQLLGPQATSLHSFVRDGFSVTEKVFGFKKGASTRCTVGQLSAVKSTCRIAEDKHLGRSDKERESTEFVFGPPENNAHRMFGTKGDSGSIVFDRRGKVMGLLFRGGLPQQTKAGYCFVTPIEDVFSDIKRYNRNAVEDIRLFVEEEDAIMGST